MSAPVLTGLGVNHSRSYHDTVKLTDGGAVVEEAKEALLCIIKNLELIGSDGASYQKIRMRAALFLP